MVVFDRRRICYYNIDNLLGDQKKEMKIIAVTGTPCTGKTTYAKKLAKAKKYYYFDVRKFIAKNKLADGYDRKNKCYLIDIKKLNSKLIQEINRFGQVKMYNGIVI